MKSEEYIISLFEYISELVDYNTETGQVLWKHREGDSSSTNRFNSRYRGKQVGFINTDGYYRFNIIFNGVQNLVYLHRVCYYIVHRVVPSVVDHINHNRADNRISNLRNITKEENSKNMRKFCTNTSGFSGVTYFKRDDVWQACIWHNNKSIHLGYFKNKEDAILARRSAEIDYGYHENHGTL